MEEPEPKKARKTYKCIPIAMGPWFLCDERRWNHGGKAHERYYLHNSPMVGLRTKRHRRSSTWLHNGRRTCSRRTTYGHLGRNQPPAYGCKSVGRGGRVPPGGAPPAAACFEWVIDADLAVIQQERAHRVPVDYQHKLSDMRTAIAQLITRLYPVDGFFDTERSAPRASNTESRRLDHPLERNIR